MQDSALSAEPRPRREARLFTLYPLAFGAVLVLLVKSALIDNDIGLLERFAVATLSLCVEALPFLLIGSLLSAAIHLYVPDGRLPRLIPRNRLLGVVTAALLGFALPVCDCGSVPVTRRLLAKGVPLNAAVAFLLSVPGVNPLVIVSTLFAFSQRPVMVLYRVGFSLGTAVLIGLLLSFLDSRYFIKETVAPEQEEPAHAPGPRRGQFLQRAGALLAHTGEDFFDMGRFFPLSCRRWFPSPRLPTWGTTRFSRFR